MVGNYLTLNVGMDTRDSGLNTRSISVWHLPKTQSRRKRERTKLHQIRHMDTLIATLNLRQKWQRRLSSRIIHARWSRSGRNSPDFGSAARGLTPWVSKKNGKENTSKPLKEAMLANSNEWRWQPQKQECWRQHCDAIYRPKARKMP